MTYKINKTDGSLLTEIIDSAIDQSSTDLTLIGKNVTGYGEYLNENFIKLLENFASTTEPNNPIQGQIWFDVSENRLKVYDGNGFRIGSGPIVSGTAPTNAAQGDFWIDNLEKQLYFYDGVDRVLAGPIYKNSDGVSGFEVDTIYDIYLNPVVIVKLMCGNTLLGIFSKAAEFTPSQPVAVNFAGTIKPGFNVATLDHGFKFNARATSADALADSLGNEYNADNLLFSNKDNYINGKITISSNEPLVLGESGESTVFVDSAITKIRNNAVNQNFSIITRSVTGFDDAVFVNALDKFVGIFNNAPTKTLDVNGDVLITGSLTVTGNTITANDLAIEDKTIELATNATTDSEANGGGILLNGATDKSIKWFSASNSWTSSESLNLVTGKSYQINGQNVLTSTALGSAIVSAPGLGLTSTVSGILDQISVDNIVINGNTISTTVGNLQLSPAGGSVVDVINSRISNLLDPIDAQDAVTKGYVDVFAVSDWQDATNNYESQPGDRLFVNTQSSSVTVILPDSPQSGDAVRFLDYNNTFDLNPIKILRYRTPASLAGTSSPISIGTYSSLATTADTGVGTGLVFDVEITENASSYTLSNTNLTIVSHGVGYKDGDVIRISGTLLNGTASHDMLITLQLENIFSDNDDISLSTKGAAFSLVYTNTSQGWRYLETAQVPSVINANLIGDVTGSLFGDVNGNVSGNVVGNVSGNLTGTVLTNSQPYITAIGTLSALTVSGAINGNITKTDLAVTGTNTLTLQSTASSISMVSGHAGLKVSAYDDTATKELYVMQVTPATVAANKPTTKLYGDVVVSNEITSNANGSTFRLPTYTTPDRDARSMSSVNYGEVIYNSTAYKMQAYVKDGTSPGVDGWVNLH
jgi:hypothetical protein